MLTSLKNLFARVRGQGLPSPPKQARLGVEGLEARLALSAVPPAPLTPPVVLQAATDTGLHAVEPDAVHGYKWRRRWPLGDPANQPGLILHPETPAAAHLVAGGADQAVVTISGQGQLVLHHPEGPLPTDFKAVTPG